MSTYLKQIKIDEASLVDKGANPEAKIIFFKRDEPLKTEDGKQFPKTDYAYTPSDNVSEWKLRLTSTPGGLPDARIVGMAIAALGEGFRGQKAQIPEEALAGVIAKVKAAWKKAHPDKHMDEMPDILKSLEGGEHKLEDKITKIKVAVDSVKAAIDKLKPLLGAQPKETDKGGRMNELNKDELSEEVKKYIADLEDQIKKLETEKESNAGKENEDNIWKDVNPVLKAQFDEMNKKVSEAEELAKTEAEARKQREFEDKAKSYPNIGSVESVSKMLQEAFSISHEAGEKLEETFKAANERIEKSDLMKELGSSNSDDSSDSYDKIVKMADEIRKEDKNLSEAQAIAAALKTKEGQELHKQYELERS